MTLPFGQRLPWILGAATFAVITLVLALGFFTDEESVTGVGPEIVLGGEDLKNRDIRLEDSEALEAVKGEWKVEGSDSGPVLVQTSTNQDFPLALVRDLVLGNADLRVRFRLRGGEKDRCAGLVFRARDPRNYYLVRANGLESNLRIYIVEDGRRRQMRSIRIRPPASGIWHELRVAAEGPRYQAWLDGRLLLEHLDERLKEGRVGLWTKADSVTEFDDFQVRGRVVRSPPIKAR
jgi:hypothetical protein